MQERFLKYLNFGNRFCGIEHTTENAQDVIRISLLKQSKNELLIDTFFEVNSTSEIGAQLRKHQHIHLVINNEKVLAKTIENEQADISKLVYKAFPNINLDEFYFEVQSTGNKHHIALCRRDYIDNLIGKYAELKFSVIDISLGNTLLGTISNFIKHEDIYSTNAKLDVNEKEITLLDNPPEFNRTFDINGLDVTCEQMLSFSAALQTAINGNNQQANYLNKTTELKDDFKQIRFFNLFLKAGGLFLLGLLLINFFFFNHYFNKVNELGQLAELNQSTKNQILKLDDMVSKKQKMVDDLLKTNGSKSSYFANEIVLSLPNSILLTALNYQPLSTRKKAGKPIVLNEKSIEVIGKSSDSEAFSDWIFSLEQQEWISKVEVTEYGRTTSRESDFKFEILIGDD